MWARCSKSRFVLCADRAPVREREVCGVDAVRPSLPVLCATDSVVVRNSSSLYRWHRDSCRFQPRHRGVIIATARVLIVIVTSGCRSALCVQSSVLEVLAACLVGARLDPLPTGYVMLCRRWRPRLRAPAAARSRPGRDFRGEQRGQRGAALAASGAYRRPSSGGRANSAPDLIAIGSGRAVAYARVSRSRQAS
jgi:hypothetical protein